MHYTKIPTALALIIQLIVDITAFTIAGIINNWITLNVTDIVIFGTSILAIMVIIQIVFFFISLSDSKQINNKIDER
ncbi:DUF3021 family protein [Phocicoccus pinnipedialis]|uniref:DUF3021 family protein n=1 Tax=Phocicoccus pinnipedialis TaxID=110845 RepID=UPI0016421833